MLNTCLRHHSTLARIALTILDLHVQVPRLSSLELGDEMDGFLEEDLAYFEEQELKLWTPADQIALVSSRDVPLILLVRFVQLIL